LGGGAEMSMSLKSLAKAFPEFAAQLAQSEDAEPEQVLDPASTEDLAALERELGVPLPESYKRFLSAARGLWLFGGAIQFGSQHPFLHDFPSLEELTDAQREVVASRGGAWPPPSQGMLCFAEYFWRADGDQVLFDVSAGLSKGEYPVVYYHHAGSPASVTRVADSFAEWLRGQCVQNMSE
jgi:hypothetical protein